MKKFTLALLVMLLVSVMVAIAGQVYDRATQSLSTTAGTATWTNGTKYAALELKRIWIERNLAAISTVTVTRVTSDGTYTQAVGSVVTAANAGSTASFTAAYLANGDLLKFSSSEPTGAVAIIEYEVQKH